MGMSSLKGTFGISANWTKSSEQWAVSGEQWAVAARPPHSAVSLRLTGSAFIIFLPEAEPREDALKEPLRKGRAFPHCAAV